MRTLQETLFESYMKIETLDEAHRPKSRLFRIASHPLHRLSEAARCAQRAKHRPGYIGVAAGELATSDARRAIERLDGSPPPKRARLCPPEG